MFLLLCKEKDGPQKKLICSFCGEQTSIPIKAIYVLLFVGYCGVNAFGGIYNLSAPTYRPARGAKPDSNNDDGYIRYKC